MMDEQHNLPDSEYIIIPNPIYDVVFRYLMEDPESATIVLSTLINEKITSLQLRTHRQNRSINPIHLRKPSTKDDLRLFHLEFDAIIHWTDGKVESVIIELQKSTQTGDIHRFKRFLIQNQHKAKENYTLPESNHANENTNRLIRVFMLSFTIESEINDLMIKSDGAKTGVFRNKQLTVNNEFIEKLDKDFIVVQLPNLSQVAESEYEHDEYKKKLFALLKLFDQNSKLKHNDHRLRLVRSFFPISLKPVINRLQWAIADFYEIDEHMFAEDEHLRHLISQDNLIAFYQNKLDFLEEQEQVSKTKQEIEIVLKQENALITELTRTIK
jgi:hypothetical protein